MNNGGITIQAASQRNVIQDNDFADTLFSWSWDALKEVGYLERGGVYFGNPSGGRGNVIRRNTFHNYFDGLDVCSGEPSDFTDEIDVYNNEIYLIGDDGLQVDGLCSNVRIWNNTFHDVLVGISFAPTVGGPVYAMRNLIYRFGVGNNDHDGRSFKFNSNNSAQSGVIYLLHNTANAATPNPYALKISSGSSPGWRLIYARNNIWASEDVTLRNDNVNFPVDLDYDNLWSSNNRDLVRWNDIAYPSLLAFQNASGQEAHGFNLDPQFMDVQTDNYRLDSASPLIDAGTLIPGINDIYFGAAPDLGAFESAATATHQIHLPAVRRP
ncbi:MAG: right-handed parallel beta-helix repeat-containing protein [Caldilineaceae bacterium]